jgi:hypothetical protein
MITCLSIVSELESLRHIFLDYINENEDENADISNKNLENIGRHAFQHHVR